MRLCDGGGESRAREKATSFLCEGEFTVWRPFYLHVKRGCAMFFCVSVCWGGGLEIRITGDYGKL